MLIERLGWAGCSLAIMAYENTNRTVPQVADTTYNLEKQLYLCE